MINSLIFRYSCAWLLFIIPICVFGLTPDEASFNCNVLTIPAVKVSDKAYLVQLALIPNSSPPKLSLLTVAELRAEGSTSQSAYDDSTQVLSVPSLKVGDLKYEATFSLSSLDPIIFEFVAASPIEGTFSVPKGLNGPDAGLTNEVICFNYQPENVIPNATYGWRFDEHRLVEGETRIGEDGNLWRTNPEYISGSQISHQFINPGRHLVQLVSYIDGVQTGDIVTHKIDIGRPYAETVFAKSDSQLMSLPKQSKSDWSECDDTWNVYPSKYNNLWIEESLSEQINLQRVREALAYFDFLFEAYSDIFGWDLKPGITGLDNYYCNKPGGSGTGLSGTGLGYESYDFFSSTEGSINTWDYSPHLHEMIHLWDFRAGLWLNAKDSAHAMTSGMEPLVSYLTGIGQNMTTHSTYFDRDPKIHLPPEFIFNYYFRNGLKRYLDRGDLSWNTYYDEPAISTEYDDWSVPEYNESMRVSGTILMSLFNMHGKEGLKNIFLEMEKLLLKNPDWNHGNKYAAFLNGWTLDLPQSARAINFMKVTADALKLDVSEYFSYWKYPVENVSDYMSKYPKSTKSIDADGDGISLLHGDRDDADQTIYPYAAELLDGKDNNQDGLIDENVYSEIAGDFLAEEISLPALIIGEISNLSDIDSFSFTTIEDLDLVVAIYAKDSATQVPLSTEETQIVSMFAGTVFLKDESMTDTSETKRMANIMYTNLDAGDHTLKVDASMGLLNNNPGGYEVQIFAPNYDPGMTYDGLVEGLYP